MQTEINNIFSENKFMLENLGQKFLLSDLENTNLHPSLKKFIFASIDDQLFSDIFRMKQRSNFDYSSEKIEKYFNLIAKEIKNKKEFSSSYIDELLHKAVEFNTNFLRKPNNTLLNFIFENSKIKTKEEIISKLDYIFYYKYISKIILSYLEKKEIKKLNRKQFAFLLSKIDEIGKKKDLQDLINTAITSMTDFYNQTNEKSKKIPFGAFKSFLEEKELNDFEQRLQLKYEFEHPKYITGSELKKLFELDFTDEEKVQEAEETKDVITKDNNDNQFDNVAENNEENIISLDTETEAADQENQIIENIIPEETSEEKTEIPSNELESEIQNQEEIAVSDEINNQENIAELDEKTDENIEIPSNEIESEIQNSEEEMVVSDEINNQEKTDEPEEKIEETILQDTSITDASEESQQNDNDENLIETETESQRPTIKQLLRSLINLNSIYNSLFKRQTAFASNNLLEDISLKTTIDNFGYKHDKTTLGEDFVAVIPENEEYVGIVVKEENYADVKNEMEEQDLEINDEIEVIDNHTEDTPDSGNDIENSDENILDNENLNSGNIKLDINDTIEDVIKSESYENEFQSDVAGVDLNNVDNDEIQEMNDLIDEKNLNLVEDEQEVTEVFTDLTYLDNENITENIAEVQPEENINTNDDYEAEDNINDNSGSDVKVAYKAFQELLINKDVTKIIETIFDYDMEDYYKLVKSISTSSNEKEGIEITDTYCKNNHVDTFHEDVLEFKTYVSDYFSQSH